MVCQEGGIETDLAAYTLTISNVIQSSKQGRLCYVGGGEEGGEEGGIPSPLWSTVCRLGGPAYV